MRKSNLHWWILLGIVIGAALGVFLNQTYLPDIAANAREIVFEGRAYDDADEIAEMKAIQAAEKTLFRQNPIGGAVHLIGQIFLKLLKMVVIPLVVASLITGIVGLGDFRKLGRMGGKALAWYLTTSLLAAFVGLALVNLIRPGVGVQVALPDAGNALASPKGFGEILLDMVPRNVPLVQPCSWLEPFGSTFLPVIGSTMIGSSLSWQ